MLLIVAGWAFAEAILFFLVADIPISYVAVRRGWRAGATAALIAALAATLGGLVTYGWAATDPEGGRAAIEMLPAIDAEMIASNRAQFERAGYLAMLAGSLSGVPYKIYAFAAGSEGRALLPFVLLSPIARLPRFLMVAAFSAGLGRLLGRWLDMRWRLALLAACWLAFYAWYFAAIPG